MYRVLISFFDQHDPALVALAALVSLAGAAVAIRLFTKLRSEDTAQFWSWLFLAGIVANDHLDNAFNRPAGLRAGGERPLRPPP
ncbi:MAG TPA: hypothetical protein VHG92_00490 [Afifellaceae bacterium]|nr:hypothetical protein [Afifellaceae bacterium]